VRRAHSLSLSFFDLAEILFTLLCLFIPCRLKSDRNSPCQCGSKKKYKHCCLSLDQERARWDDLEDKLRGQINEYCNEFFDREGALIAYGKEDVNNHSDLVDRRLFYDWYIHDYIVPNKNNTIIKLFTKEYESALTDLEKDTVKAWSDSVSRFLEILDIRRGVGYKVKDIFNETNEFFVYDKSSSQSLNKYDILYSRPYPIGNITRLAGSGIILAHHFLPHIKKYVLYNLESSREFHQVNDNTGNLAFETYLRNESLSIIHYLDSLKELSPTVMTPEGDISVFCRSEFAIKKNRRSVMLALNSSKKEFARLENEGKTIRYDWIEELEDSKQFGYENGDHHQDVNTCTHIEQKRVYVSEPEKLTFRTILWLPPNEYKDTSLHSSSKGKKDKKGEQYTPYRVLGNLSLTAKTLIVECLSDRLLKRCNDTILRLVGSKHLIHLGDSYSELMPPNTAGMRQNSWMEYEKHEHGLSEDEEKENEEYSTEQEVFEDKLPNEVKQQIDNYFEEYYENWLYLKLPVLDNMTPVEAAKTEKGRNVLKELLKDIENTDARNSRKNLPPFPVAKMKKRLGL
jgi:SEC-C motif